MLTMPLANNIFFSEYANSFARSIIYYDFPISGLQTNSEKLDPGVTRNIWYNLFSA